MSKQAFDAFTRYAAQATSRRGSLLTLGGAALAAGLGAQVGTEAKKNPAKKVKKQNAAKCSQEIEECKTVVLGMGHSPEIEVAYLACCEHCFVGDFLTCLLAISVDPPS